VAESGCYGVGVIRVMMTGLEGREFLSATAASSWVLLSTFWGGI
jgi:hypothetical protein